jgi:hypothetical protein
MPELDLRAEGRRLEDLAHQPEFSAITERRVRRTRRWAVAGAAVLTLAMVFAGVSLASGRHEPGPPTTSVPPTPQASIESLAASPSGALYAVRMEGDMPHLRRSTDLGVTWTDLGRISEPGRLVVATDEVMWVIGEGEMYGTSNAGKDWNSWQAVFGVNSYSLVGQRLWYVEEHTVLTSDAGAMPIGRHMDPATINSVVAFDNTAIIQLSANDEIHWGRSDDTGLTWTPMENPCAVTSQPGDHFSGVTAAPDGTLWVVCAMTAGAGQQPKDLAVSTDGGRTWKSRGALESSGYGTDVYPFSATVAWRTGARADLYRTTDGVHWTAVAQNTTGAFKGFAAVDASTAVYADEEGIHVTTDGGRTWVIRP